MNTYFQFLIKIKEDVYLQLIFFRNSLHDINKLQFEYN